jgi:uncharacterized protein YfiM (DUF2279 family)
MRGTATRRDAAALLLAAAALLAAPTRARADDAWPAPRGAGRPPLRPAPQLGPTRAPDPWLGLDKGLHFCASVALAGGGYGLGALATPDIPGRVAVGAAVALGAGVAKETLDAAGFGTPSWRDLAWDVLGATVGLGLSVALDLVVRPDHF